MSLSPDLMFALMLLYFVSLMFALTIGIELGQSGTVKVTRRTRNLDERRLKRRMKQIGKLVGSAEADITEIIDSAVEHMRAAGDRDRDHTP